MNRELKNELNTILERQKLNDEMQKFENDRIKDELNRIREQVTNIIIKIYLLYFYSFFFSMYLNRKRLK